MIVPTTSIPINATATVLPVLDKGLLALNDFFAQNISASRIISLGHFKYAALNLPLLKKYPLIYPCLKGQIRLPCENVSDSPSYIAGT